MKNIVLVTDSTAYLTEDEVNRYGIHVVPLSVNFEDGSIVDSLGDAQAFFARVDASAKVPFTSQPSVGQFVEVYEKLMEQNKEVISIHISSKLSGTVESAGGAARMLNQEKITVFDSQQTAFPLAFLVLAAAQWIEEGLSRPEVVARLEKSRQEIRTYFVPDTLEYLKKGGRIGGAQALLGTLLQIKPVLYLNEGRVEVFDKVRTRKKAIARVLEEMPPDSDTLQVAVAHCLAYEEAVQVKEMILGIVPRAQVEIRDLGPVISIHTGPRVLGIATWPR
ncbi:MAG: DegV family protein [Bacillota bacterium]